MSKIDGIHASTTDVERFASEYFDYLKSIFDSVDRSAIREFESEFQDTFTEETTLFVVGNGGSAATASTMANDIGFDLLKKTSITKPLRVVSLADNNAVVTAIANDTGYENLFLNQLRIHYRDGDKLLVISASGNSENLVRAAQWVKERKGKVLGLLGFDGGRLLGLCDPAIHVKTERGEYGPVEDLHLIINHIFAHWFQNTMR